MLKKYLQGNARDGEISTIDHWYQSFEEEKPMTLSEEEKASVKQEIWEKIVPVMMVDKKVRVMPKFMKVATWAAIATGVILTFFYLKNRQSPDHDPLAFTTVTTKNGERRTITIKDGTQLILNAGTTIHVYDDFSDTRRVDLVDGEVFFEVKRDVQRPFLIHSDSLTIRVLGTSFNVSAYKELHHVSVGVVAGKVSVKKDTATLGILQKTDELVYDKSLRTYKILPMDGSLLAWKEGRLPLNDASFHEMTILMKKNFGIDILTDDKLIQDTKYTTELFTNMTAGEAMEVLAAIHKLKIKKINNQMVLYR
jgi:transmembrane sensor